MANVFANFPHTTYRRFQKEAIKATYEAFENGYKNVIVESPCGSGKSAIAICLGKHYESSYLLTSQKVLQEQYIRDYSSIDVAQIMGRSNYACKQVESSKCDDGLCFTGKCPAPWECPYDIAKKRAQSSKVALMNYSYFLHATRHTESFPERSIMIYDEAHCVDGELMRFVEFRFSSHSLSRLEKDMEIPEYKNVDEYVDWINNLYILFKRVMDDNNNDITKLSEAHNLGKATFDYTNDEIARLKNDNDNINTNMSKIVRFLDTYEEIEWIHDLKLKDSTHGDKIVFKPVEIAPFAKKFMFDYAGKHMFMSATILSKKNFCRNLGIELDEAHFIKVPSTFPTTNRPTYIMNSGPLTMAKKYESLPYVVQDIEEILTEFLVEKGMIYTHTYEIAKYIQENIDKSARSRLKLHLDGFTRGIVLADFIKSQKNSVLVTPSLGEGIDLKDDLARFIIIVKVPYGFLGDPQIKRRQEIDYSWYQWKTALSLIQTAGRGVRHDQDYCKIYLMDSGFSTFINRNKGLFPEYFTKALRDRDYG